MPSPKPAAPKANADIDAQGIDTELVRKLAERGQGLQAGHIVMAGGMTEAVAVAPGDTVVARFAHLGTVEIPFR